MQSNLNATAKPQPESKPAPASSGIYLPISLLALAAIIFLGLFMNGSSGEAGSRISKLDFYAAAAYAVLISLLSLTYFLQRRLSLILILVVQCAAFAYGCLGWLISPAVSASVLLGGIVGFIMIVAETAGQLRRCDASKLTRDA